MAALLARAGDLTDDEIELSGLPLNLRTALRNARTKASNTASLAAAEATVTAHAVEGVNPDPLGELVTWLGDDEFLDVDRGGSLLVKYGQPLWLPQDGGVLIGTVFSKHVDPKIIARGVRNGTVTRTQYAKARSNWAEGSVGAECAIIDLTAPSSGDETGTSASVSALTALGVRFQR